MAIERYCTEKNCAEMCIRDKDGKCVFEYVASNYEPEFRWLGDDPPPAKWMANGTLVYRSFADFCD